MEANPERGELAVEVGDRTYVLRIRLNALCALQQRTKKTYGELLADLSLMNVESVRELLWTYLQPYHAKEFTKLDVVGDLIDDLGGHVKVVSILAKLFELNRPKKDASGGEDGNPRTAGTGHGSSVTVSASASTH